MDFHLNRSEYLADFLVTPFLIIWACVFAWCLDESSRIGVDFILAGLIGYLAWSPVEYLIHRHVFHGPFRRAHWAHHRRPRYNIGVPPLFTVTIQMAVYILLVVVCGLIFGGLAIGSGLFVGFVSGYLVYNIAHFFIHRYHVPKGHFMRPVFERHALHHSGKEVNFNVLWPWCDKLFGTYEKP